VGGAAASLARALLACISGALSVGAAVQNGKLLFLIAAQAIPGLALALGLMLAWRRLPQGSHGVRLSSWRALRQYLP